MRPNRVLSALDSFSFFFKVGNLVSSRHADRHLFEVSSRLTSIKPECWGGGFASKLRLDHRMICLRAIEAAACSGLSEPKGNIFFIFFILHIFVKRERKRMPILRRSHSQFHPKPRPRREKKTRIEEKKETQGRCSIIPYFRSSDYVPTAWICKSCPCCCNLMRISLLTSLTKGFTVFMIRFVKSLIVA